jgi:hypothetical protein
MTVCSSKSYYRVIYYRPLTESYYSSFFHKNLTPYLIVANSGGQNWPEGGRPG